MTASERIRAYRNGQEYELDDRDSEILAQRVNALGLVEGPRVGDYIVFADGTERRISYVTPAEWMPEVDIVQTSKGGSWYLGDGYISFSGSLYAGVKRDTLTETSEVRAGSVWFFRHDFHTAHNGVDTEMMFRVYECGEEATR
jgi:hypothetical protein